MSLIVTDEVGSSEHMRESVQLAVFSGFLGSGKTTILQRIIPTLEAKGEKVCVIVNDLSMDNIDVFAFSSIGSKENSEYYRNNCDRAGSIVAATHTKRTHANSISINHDKNSVFNTYPEQTTSAIPTDKERNNSSSNNSINLNEKWKNEVLGVTALSGGCICCNLLSELVYELLKIYNEGKYTYICIECTGVADTTPLITTLASLPSLRNKIEIDVVCTVLHAPTLQSVTTQEVCNTENRQQEEHITKYLVNVNELNVMCRRQMSGANVILINNWEHLLELNTDFSPDLLQAWETAILTFVKESNSHVRVFFTNSGYVAFDELLYRQRCFDLDGSLLYFLKTYAAMNQSLDSLWDKLHKKHKKPNNIKKFLPSSEKEGKKVDSLSGYTNHFKDKQDNNTVVVSETNGNDDGDDEEEDEEAFELRLLGIQTFTFTSSNLIISTRALCQNMSTKRGANVMHGIIRSKGFFDAIDDIHCDHSSSSSIRCSGGNGNINNDMSNNVAETSISERVTQFRWQSVNNHFDYGPVLPPYVSLHVAATTQNESDSTNIDTEVLDLSQHQLRKENCTRFLRCKIVFIGTFNDAEKKRQELHEFFKLCAIPM